MSQTLPRDALHANWHALAPLIARDKLALILSERMFTSAEELLRLSLRSDAPSTAAHQKASAELAQAMSELHTTLTAQGVRLPEGPLSAALAATPPETESMLELLLALFEHRSR